MDTFGRLFLMIGPLLIFAIGGIILILLLEKKQPVIHWLSLALIPALTLLAAYGSMYFVTQVLQPSEGSGALLGLVLLGIYALGLLLYYPVLLGYGLYKLWKRRSAKPAIITS